MFFSISVYAGIVAVSTIISSKFFKTLTTACKRHTVANISPAKKGNNNNKKFARKLDPKWDMKAIMTLIITH